jgi:hypothetical protein
VVVGFGFREDLRWGTENGFRGCCTAEGKMGEGGKKCDLKVGHEKPKSEYVRTYRSTFDRTCAGAWVCVCVIRSNLCKQVRTHACSAVCEKRVAAVKLTKARSNAEPCTFERIEQHKNQKKKKKKILQNFYTKVK